MNRLCTLHGRPFFSEPRPYPRWNIPPSRRGAGGLCGARLWTASRWLGGGLVHGPFHYRGLWGLLRGLFYCSDQRETAHPFSRWLSGKDCPRVRGKGRGHWGRGQLVWLRSWGGGAPLRSQEGGAGTHLLSRTVWAPALCFRSGGRHGWFPSAQVREGLWADPEYFGTVQE